MDVIRKAYAIEVLMRPHGREVCGLKDEEWEDTRPISEVYKLVRYKYKSDRETEGDEKSESEDTEDIRIGTNDL